MMGADPLDLAVFDSDLQTLSPDHHQHQDSSSDVRSRQADISTGSAGAVVFIGDLTRFCDEESVIKFFEENLSEECRGVPGKIVERVLIKRAKAGVSMGYGFVCMRNAHTAERAIALLDGKMFNGRRIRVRRGVRKDGGEFVFPLSSDLRDHADEISPVTNSSAFEPIVRDQSDVAKRATEVVGLNSGHSNLVNNNSLYIRFVSVEVRRKHFSFLSYIIIFLIVIAIVIIDIIARRRARIGSRNRCCFVYSINLEKCWTSRFDRVILIG